MILTYEQFKKIVPKETMDFVDDVLPYLDRYLRKDIYLHFQDDQTSIAYESKANFLLLYCLSNIKKYNTFLGNHEFDSSKYKVGLKHVEFNGNKEEMFERWNAIFNIYNDKTYYASLSPLDIVAKALELYDSKCNHSIFEYLFSQTSLKAFRDDVEQQIVQEKIALEHQTENEIYGSLPISVISYLETASKLRTILFLNLKNGNELVKINEEDIVPISLLISLYFYNETTIMEANQLSEQKIIQSMLQEKGISIDKLLSEIGVYINTSNIRDTSKNVYALKQFYTKYYQNGANEGISDFEITVSRILDNVFDRDFTNSFAIEKVFAKLNCYVRSFLPVSETIEKVREDQARKFSMSYVKSFYEELSKETKNFIEFTAKVYLLIIKKMKERTHNKDVLVDEDDADTLALYIASCYHGLAVNEFFADYGVTLEKVLHFLKLQISKEEIEAVNLDRRVLVDRYKRFVYEGVNRGKYAKNIQVPDIAYNLCNRNFNKSTIMEDVFSKLTNSIVLQSDFLDQLKEHMKRKEQKRKLLMAQRFFKDMSSSTMEYLENVSRIHQYLLKSISQYSEADIRIFSLLLGIFNTSKNDIAGFFESKSITVRNIYKFLNISPGNLLKESIDIDILKEQYGIFIFGGYNKNLGRKEITISNIAQNIFSKEVYSSIFISKFLGSFNLSYEDFEHFEEQFQSYFAKITDERKVSEGKSLVEKYDTKAQNYIKNVMRIHHRLIQVAYQDESVANLISYNHDIRELSLLLGVFTVTSEVERFFEKHGLTLETIYALVGLDSNFLTNLATDDIDYRLAIDVYQSFLTNETNIWKTTESDLIAKLFNKPFEKESLILEQIVSSVGSNYDILKEEVITRKDYELSLSMEERIKLLTAEKIDDLDLMDIKSILRFGNSLSIHSKYIHDELPKLMMNDASAKSVQTISQIINRVYIDEPLNPKKQSFWKRLFAPTLKQESKKTLNLEVIGELKQVIDSNIAALSNEILGYDSIRQYIEVYRRKNRSHYMITISEIEKMEREVANLTPEKEEEFSRFLTITSRLQIMRDKSNRFTTSNHLMKQELFKVNQAIVNHFITINALEMARDDLFPLIGSEMALTQGRNTENKSLDLSENVIGLFQSLLSRNVTTAVENMEKLKQSGLPSETFNLLSQDIEVYLQGLNQANVIEGRIESLDIDQINQPTKEIPKLELTNTMIQDEKPKQKRIQYPKSDS